ncbi:reverse transcriptase domain-containing protein [Tanacetum coccineum]
MATESDLLLLERVETVEQELETLHDRAEAVEQQIEVLHYSLGIAWERIIESHICMEDVKALLQESKVKYVACTLLDGALTWWNSYLKRIGLDAAYETTWRELKQMIIDEYCPRNEVQKIETKLWNLSVKGTNIVGYIKRFQELALLCPTMVTPEYKMFGWNIWGVAYDIQGDHTTSNPTRIRESIYMAHDLMDQVVRAKATKNGKNKRKWEDNHINNSEQQNK